MPAAVADGRHDLPGQAVYLDTPVLTALRQIAPFFRDGIFGAVETPVFLRMKPLIRMQLAVTSLPKGIDVRRIAGKKIARLPMAEGSVVFYPYNSMSNMNAVTNRASKHVLTLHGESNKLASNRPAARLYDYICVAGSLGRDRYLDARIFTRREADGGRLVMMGDSFVQRLPWIHPTPPNEVGALLYCPTWEGYGPHTDSYNSIEGLGGFDAARRAARALDVSEIVIKPHPYLGLLKPRLLLEFVRGVRRLMDDGFAIRLALGDASMPVRMIARLRLSALKTVDEEHESLPVKFGLCDVSGMEAVFLKQRIAHMVLTRACDIPPSLDSYYIRKAILPGQESEKGFLTYLENHHEVDAAHRAQVFGWQDPALEMMSNDQRRAWLIAYAQSDPFWNGMSRQRSKTKRG
jgi:hypothetical protein